jgi:DNA polymerase III alpha subunit (gram-positive type)
VRTFIDFEYLYPEMTSTSGRPNAQHLRQLVQIGAIRYDSFNVEIVRFELLVQPTYTPQLPAFFSELTGIEQIDMQRAVTLHDSLNALQEFLIPCGTEVYTFDRDFEVLMQNCSYIDFQWQLPEWLRVVSLLPKWNVNPNLYSSGTLHKAAGIELVGQVHDALFDVQSMAAAVFAFESM